MVSLDTLLDVPLLPTLPLGPPIPLAVSCVPTASSLRSLRPHPHRASRVPGSSGVTHTMAHITPSRILQTSPCFIHVFQLFNDSPPARGLQSDRYQIAILWYFSHQHCLYVGLWPYCTVYSHIDTRTVPSMMLVYGLWYGSWLISYHITPVVYSCMPLQYGAQPYGPCNTMQSGSAI